MWGEVVRFRDIFLPAKFSTYLQLNAFCKGLSLNEGLQSVMKSWLANNQN